MTNNNTKILVNMQTMIEDFVEYFKNQGLDYTDTSYIKLKKEGTTLAGIYKGTKVSNFFVKVLNESNLLKDENLQPYKTIPRKKYTITYFKIKNEQSFNLMMELIKNNINDILELKSNVENEIVKDTEEEVENTYTEENEIENEEQKQEPISEEEIEELTLNQQEFEQLTNNEEEIKEELVVPEIKDVINQEQEEQEEEEKEEPIQIDPEKMQSILTEINNKLKTLFKK